MPALPFNPADLSTALPDVIWALVIALILAIVTSRPPKPPSVDDALASIDGVVEADVIEVGDGS